MTQVAPKKLQKKRFLPQYKVILLNDDYNDFGDVCEAVVRIMRWPIRRAEEKVWEAHSGGSSILCVTHKEKAEMIQEQFSSCKIGVEIEPE